MALRLKWSNTGASLIGPRDGAMVRQIDKPRSPRRGPVHIHLHGVRTADQSTPQRSPAPQSTGGLPAARRDQTTEPEEGGFRGSSVDLRGRDQEGRNWGVRIYGPAGAGYSEEDPDKIFTSTGDANRGGQGENDPGGTFEQRMAQAISPSGKAADRGPASLRGRQRLIDQHYRRR